MTITKPAPERLPWYAMPADAAASRLDVRPDRGLDADEVARRLDQYGPNELPTEPPPRRRAGTKGVAARAAAEPLGGGPGPAGQPDEHHAADRRWGQSGDRRGGVEPR